MRHVAIGMACLLFLGCASSGKPFSPVSQAEKGKALVYVYHPADYSCRRPSDPNFLYINEKRIFMFPCDTYTVLALNPGSYRFSIQKNVFYLPAYEKRGAQVFAFEPGNTYFVKYTEDYSFTDTATGRAIDITTSNLAKSEGPAPPPDIGQTFFLDPGMTPVN
ncbi:MAG: DUF2846 domain-containing protein [Burkholderiales bacterium]